MAIEVGIAELKAKLSHYIRLVKQGQEIVIKDRDTPVATLSPHRPARPQGLRIRPATLPVADLNKIKPARPKNLEPGAALKALQEVRRERLNDLVDEWLSKRGEGIRR